MPGTEVALLRLATTVVGAVARAALAPKPGAGLVADPVRPLPRPAKPDRLARVLGARLTASYADLPEHEQLAALASVQDAFARAGELTAERLFALDLDETRLRAELSAPDPGLSARAAGLYDDLLLRCCAHLLQQLTAHPSFTARAAVEQTRAGARTRDLVEDVRARLGPRPDAAALAFEERYAAYVATAHSRMGLFGLTLGRSTGDWPLETAYISLAVSAEPGRHDGRDHVGQATVTVEQALARSRRLLLRGPAGSGKSTLVQWLALNAARRTFGTDLGDWNRCVPFVLRLRAFTAHGGLPLPEDFLRAAGIPLHGSAPAGWADALLAGGRGLVLVDGVDEVPAHLRRRTEEWLRDLMAAYPDSRYVVTTRPSAVPESWLSGAGFEAHSLLPMGGADLDSFIGHWHEAARSECGREEQRRELDGYEAALRRAVTRRRDLGRLATNPLMCALLCALNRDRRMQLPRARKELYDAALDMLLVRRDNEREITGVEGVELTREEQTALLQRLAYWLIRNGQQEADRDEAEAMVAEWLTAMPQVRGTAERVFSHLLIRSGLLREPVPGAVGFVHRTFQDYLGARAAVEARDFGVLVRHAHDDTWHDVVQMAVGHARADERARLLRRLLKRARQTRGHSSRLVLLAAASLEHAPELDPAVRAEVQERTAALLPPRSRAEAEELAEVGEPVLDLLPGPQEVEGDHAAGWVVMTAALIGGAAAYEVVKRYRDDERDGVAAQLSYAWGSFDTEVYAREILARRAWNRGIHVNVANAGQLAALRHIPQAPNIRLEGAHDDLSPLVPRGDLTELFVYDNPALSDITPVASMRSLTEVGLSLCPQVRDLSPLAELPLTRVSLIRLHPDTPRDHLAPLTRIRELTLGHDFGAGSIGELPLDCPLGTLFLSENVDALSLEGVERWTGLTTLSVQSLRHLHDVSRTPFFRGLDRLDLHRLDLPDLGALDDLTSLTTLIMRGCSITHGLAPLGDLPSLAHVGVYSSPEEPPLDLSPLAGLDTLTIALGPGTRVTGTELIPPENILRE
ncbi:MULTISPECIES: NACHT domain-containing protein [Streptomyces]|uniref:NACHT domain-containing protein n=1 Tax=Streptomyces salyersiae TaxID=3075530 RepID=A0ABU2RWX2_9ACTN|nr:NACHT domain-containing protein [Streptomyces sp. DSM 41770]MDT0432073.1 NACHT domain-containing protein [Streptomyces sp. DSM 41770]